MSNDKIETFLKAKIHESVSEKESEKWTKQLKMHPNSSFKKNLGVDLSTVNSQLHKLRNPKEASKTYHDIYKRIPIKTMNEFQNASRKDLLKFSRKLNQLDLQVTGKFTFYNKVKALNQEILYELSDHIIPFNWHDSNIGDPIDVFEGWYLKETIRQNIELDNQILNSTPEQIIKNLVN
jgi:hypothetical protein